MSIVRDIVNNIAEGYTVATSSSNSCVVDCSLGTNFIHTLSENTTISLINVPSTDSFALTLKIVQDASASGYAFTWKTGSRFANATQPELTNEADAIDTFVLTTDDEGTAWDVYVAGQAMGIQI